MTARRVAAACLLAALPAAAQSSASYRWSEAVINAGGHPANGTIVASAGFRLSLVAIGDAVVGGGSAPSFRLDSGVVASYRPAGEVRGLRFTDGTHLEWDADGATGDYALYRDALAALPGGYGRCLQSGMAAPAAQDLAVPAPAAGFYYLATARNRLREEGTKGAASSGVERGNAAACP